MTPEISAITNKLEACVHLECKMRETCLRGQVYAERVESEDYMAIVNPERCRVDEAECQYYKTWERVRFAYGFVNLIGLLPPYIFDKVRTPIYSYLGEKPYYNKRKGKQVITPEEQEFIIKTISEAGFVLPEGKEWFDRYEDGVRLKNG